MEHNSDRMGFALIALSVVAFVLLAVNGILQPTVKGFFNGFKDWQTQTFNGINETNKQDVTHTAYSWREDGTDRFTTTKPNLNLLDGTKDFSGDWWFYEDWHNDGTYKGVTVKKKIGQWGGIAKLFIAPKSGVYTFSAYVKGVGNIQRHVTLNDANVQDKWQWIGGDFDWTRNSFSINLNAGDKIYVQYNSVTSGTWWTAGHKWEEGSTATPHMPSSSEVKPSDQPKYIGTYTDHLETASQEPTKYTWKVNPDYHD